MASRYYLGWTKVNRLRDLHLVATVDRIDQTEYVWYNDLSLTISIPCGLFSEIQRNEGVGLEFPASVSKIKESNMESET
jgi:hypothetical protein